MVLLVALVAGLLVFAETQDSDQANLSNRQGFLSKYLSFRYDASKTSLDHNDKFITANLKRMKYGNGRDALSHHKSFAQHSSATDDIQYQDVNGGYAGKSVSNMGDRSFAILQNKIGSREEKKAVQKMLANGNSNTPITLSTFGVGLFALLTVLGVRIRRARQPVTILTSNGLLGSDMSEGRTPDPIVNILEMKSQGSDVNGGSMPTGAYGETSRSTKGIVSGLTALVNLQGGRSANAEPRVREFTRLSPEQIRDGLATDFRNEYLWSGKITPELYDEDCVFTDPTLSFKGLRTFETNLANLDFWINLLVPDSRRCVELFSLRIEDGGAVVEARWRMLGSFRLPWAPMLDLKGTTRYRLSGEGGRVKRYDETWDLTAGDALKQLLSKGVRFEPEFWAGRREGAPAPVPGVRAPDGSPTFVVLPGFGNDAVDYISPLGLPRETSLSAALERRNCRVVVLPVARGDWLQVLTKGVFDWDFLVKETAAADSPAFGWYADKVREALADIPGDVILVGHSAGGWLARGSCLDPDIAARVRAVVTLGAPHVPPPAGTPCATRGVVRAIYDGPRTPGVLVTVSSDAVRGDESPVAADGYARVCGDATGAGDGVVPLSSAHLGDADLQLTLACTHSINVPGTSDPTDDWYGAEKWVDAWFAPTLDLLAKPAWLRELPF